jgi:hypothetical protein
VIEHDPALALVPRVATLEQPARPAIRRRRHCS